MAKTGFTAARNGWHFINDFTNPIIGHITTHGLCGGMAYSSLDYWYNGLAIPTHRQGDFGSPSADAPPNSSRLYGMLHNRLLDSFSDNFGKWLCIYPELFEAIGAALGLVVGGILGAAAGFILGDIAGTAYEAFDCPDSVAGMTSQELPTLRNHLDAGNPVPLGLVWHDTSFFQISHSHQVVAYDYSITGDIMTINIYDSDCPNQECMLTVNMKSPGLITESCSGGCSNGPWACLLVEDGYQQQWPSYGPDLALGGPVSASLTGPVAVVKTVVPAGPAKLGSIDPRGAKLKVINALLQQQYEGRPLQYQFAVQNLGEFPAHYSTLGLEIDPPSGSPSYLNVGASGDNPLAPGAAVPVNLNFPSFGSEPGWYELTAGYTSTQGDWFTLGVTTPVDVVAVPIG